MEPVLYETIPIQRVLVNPSLATNNTIVAAVTNTIIRITDFMLRSDGTVAWKFKSGTGTDLTPNFNCAPNIIIQANYHPYGHLETAAGEALVIELNAAVALEGWLNYVLVPT